LLCQAFFIKFFEFLLVSFQTLKLTVKVCPRAHDLGRLSLLFQVAFFIFCKYIITKVFYFCKSKYCTKKIFLFCAFLLLTSGLPHAIIVSASTVVRALNFHYTPPAEFCQAFFAKKLHKDLPETLCILYIAIRCQCVIIGTELRKER